MSKICMATGGTGGHIYPALALASAFKEQDPANEVVFFGNDDRMEAQLIPAAGYPFRGLHASGLEGSTWMKIRALFQQIPAYFKAKKLIRQENPDLVIGFGGYVSPPVILAAHSLGIPTVIHEQNSIVGKSNQLVAKKADAIVTCYEKADEVFGEENTRLLGNPRASVAANSVPDEEYWKQLGLDPKKKTILIVMGSLGSSSVNELMKSALKGIDDGLQFLYVCGKDNDQDLDLFSGQKNIKVVPYIDTLKIYKKLDGIICRAGATTLAEITALGLPAILVPSPYVAANHQFYNASQLVQAGAADMIEEKDLNAQTLQAHIRALFLDEKRMEDMRQSSLNISRPFAAKDILDLCQSLIKGENQ